MNNAFASGRDEAKNYKFKIPRKNIKGRIGDRLGNGVGNSLEFQEYKDYEPGDEIRHIDWRVYGKTDKLIVKRYQEELQPRVDVITDLSRSLQYPDKFKAAAAMFLSGLFLESTVCTGSISSWWSFGSGFKQILPYSVKIPVKISEIKTPEFSGTGSLEMDLTDHHFTKNSIRIFISDFLWDAEPEKIIRKMSDSASAVYIVIVLTSSELDPDMSGYNTLIDSENNETSSLLINNESLKVYKNNLQNHLELWEHVSVKYGAVYSLLKAEDVLNYNLIELIKNGVIEQP